MGLRCLKRGGARRSHSRLLTREMDTQRGRRGGCWRWGCRARNGDVSPWSDSWIIEIVLGQRSKGESFEGHLTCEGAEGVHPQCIVRCHSFALQTKQCKRWNCGPAQGRTMGQLRSVSSDATASRPYQLRCVHATSRTLPRCSPSMTSGPVLSEIPRDVQSRQDLEWTKGRQVSAAAETRSIFTIGPK